MNDLTSSRSDNSGQPIRIALVDDHPVVREGLRAFLQLAADLDIVGEAASGEAAVELCDREAPDVILMDLVMPGRLDGIAATQEIAERHPTTRVISLTSYQDSDRVVRAIEAGAIGYLRKDVNPDDLLFAIRQAAQGRTILEANAFAALRERAVADGAVNASSSTRSSEVGVAQLAEPLTSREQEVLEALAQGMSNKEIAAYLGITEKTAKVHISHILSKLGVYDRTQAVLAASRLGLIRI